MVDIKNIIDYLMCPNCGSELEIIGYQEIACKKCAEIFKISKNVPILLPVSGKQQDTDFVKFVEGFISEYKISGLAIKDNEMKFLKENLDINNAIILDAGGGWGYISNELKEAKKVFLVDLCFSQLAEVSANLNDNIVPICANIENHVLKPKVNIIICAHVLEHLLDPKKALIVFHDMLREDGKLLIVIPILNIQLFRNNIIWIFRNMKLKMSKVKRSRKESDHLRVYSDIIIMDELAKTGFVIDKIKYTPFFPRLLGRSKFFSKLFAHTVSIICKK